MPSYRPIAGVIPAILTPRDANGALLPEVLGRFCRHAIAMGAAGLCMNGATGEYSAATAEERALAVRTARAAAGAEGLVVAGLGAAEARMSLELGAQAAEAGAELALLPVPHFFRYGQGEIAEFYARTALGLPFPTLIYNLPAFTGGLETETVVELLARAANVIGIKDSSGRLETLETLSGQAGQPAVRLVGHDGVLVQAFRKGWAQGCISGVAGVLPELTVAIWRASQAQDDELLERLDAHLKALIRWIELWPTPWALKIVAQYRGFVPATYSLPLSAVRRAQVEASAGLLETWWNQAQGDLEQALGRPVSWQV